MKAMNQINHIKAQTNEILGELTPTQINKTTRSFALYYKGGKYMCQGFFAQPLVGKLNSLEGLERDADVYFRSVRMVGTNLFHIRLVGDEDQIHEMISDIKFYQLVRGISTTLNEDLRVRPYLEVGGQKEHWDILMSLDMGNCCIANQVMLDGKETRIHNVVIVGDRMIGLTPKNRCVIGQLIPDIIENTGMRMEVELMEEVNKLGSVDLIEPVPNSEDLFLVAIKNTIYQFDIWGDMTRFDELEDEVQCINSINFNHTSSVLATNRGLYEIDVQEMPNMVKTQSLPRRISANHLRDEFEVALYTEDPYVLGIHPAVGIFSKTKDKKLYFF